MKLVERIYQSEHNLNFKTRYMKYRAGRLKHQYWLWNRKSKDKKLVDEYDDFILKNCKPGRTVFFASSGYYLNDIYGNIDSIETHAVVKEFYPTVTVINSRDTLADIIPHKYDNFAVVNNRGDHWVDVNGLTQHLINYSKILNPGARIFYSFRDTQIHFNRLTTDHREHFLSWAQSLSTHGLTLVWHDIQFKEKDLGSLENPDTTNGNLKFWFVYKGTPWEIVK